MHCVEWYMRFLALHIPFILGVKVILYSLLKERRNYTALQNLKVEYNAKDEDNYCMNPEKSGEVWDLILGYVAYSLGKCNRILGRNSSVDFPQLVPAYTIHTVTIQCGL